MSAWTESSVLVRTVRRLGAGNLIGRACGAIWRGVKALDAGIARAAADKDGRDDDERLRAVLRGSRVFNALDRAFAAPGVAWESSRTRVAVESIRSDFVALELWRRVRLLGWMLLVALTTRIALYVVSGAPVTAVTLALWGMVAAVALLMLLAPSGVAAAWIDWRGRHRKEK